MTLPQTTTVTVERDGHIAEVILNRPDKGNAMSPKLFEEVSSVFDALDADAEIRAIILRGSGRNFTYGLDLMAAMSDLGPHLQGGLAGKRKGLLALIRRLQHQTNAPARAATPVIAAVHGWCIGGGLDLIAACDIRLASANAKFSLREARIGIVADLGSLQRLPRIIGDAATRELALTAKDFDAARAMSMGLVSQVLDDEDALLEAARAEARQIAALSPLVVEGVKHILGACDSKTVEEGLDYVAVWNSAFLASEDFGEAINAFMTKREPKYKGR